MPNFIPSLTVDQTIDALADYIGLFTSAEIIRGNVNRTPMPSASFIVLTEIASIQLSKPTERFGDFIESIESHNRIDIQVDFYGWDLSDIAQSIYSVFRTIWSVNKFPSNIVPLYCSEPVKIPIVNAEEQYEQRWTMKASLQYNPIVTVPQDTFNTPGETEVIPSDIIYPVI